MNQSALSPQAASNGYTLLVLGVLSFLFGPLTAIPGLIISKQFRPFSRSAAIGYALCWAALILWVLMFAALLFTKMTPRS